MIKYKELGFVAYPATNMARARKFYEGVLGLKSTRDFPAKKGAHFVEYAVGKNGTLAVGVSPDWKPSPHGPTVALEVENFDSALAQLKKHRVKPTMGPIDSPKCLMVVIQDPDGNKITLHHRKKRSAT